MKALARALHNLNITNLNQPIFQIQALPLNYSDLIGRITETNVHRTFRGFNSIRASNSANPNPQPNSHNIRYNSYFGHQIGLIIFLMPRQIT